MQSGSGAHEFLCGEISMFAYAGVSLSCSIKMPVISPLSVFMCVSAGAFYCAAVIHERLSCH